MKKGVIWFSLLVLLILTAATTLAQILGRFDLSWYLLSAGGGQRSSTHYQVDDILGHWADGQSVSDRYQIDAGFWGDGRTPKVGRLYLPVAIGTDQSGSNKQSLEPDTGH